MVKLTTPGSLSRFTLTISNFDGSKFLDISNLVLNLSITEDIFKNTLYGSVMIRDGVGLLEGLADDTNGFPIVGEEFLQLSATPYNQDNIILRFMVYSVDTISYSKNSRIKEYTLNFCSEEHLIDSTSLVMKSYNGTHSDTLKSMLSDYLYIDKANQPYKGKVTKTINMIQPTRGIQKVIIPMLPPIQAAQFLARRSIADDGTMNTGTYLFFENFKGFNFCDLEYLIQQGMKKFKSLGPLDVNTDYHPLLYRLEDPILSMKVSEKSNRDLNVIIAMNQIHYFDTIEKMKRGLIESNTTSYDFIQGNLNDTRYRYLDNLEKNNTNTTGLGDISGNSYPTNSNSFMQFATSKDNNSYKYNRLFIVPKDSSQPDTYLDTIYPNRASYFTSMAQNMFTIDTYGNTKINAGDVIYASIPSAKDTSQNKFINGYYLVCTINHIFTQNYYHTKMDIYKNAFDTQLPNLSSSAS